METTTQTSSTGHAYLGQLEAMKNVAEALEGLTTEDMQVVLDWAYRQFLKKAPTPVPALLRGGDSRVTVPAGGEAIVATPEFKSLGDLFAAAAPESGPERALVVGYWVQEIERSDDLEGARLNSELTHLGYRLANITTTMTLLMNQKPALVVQTKKTGTARQARKRYRLTQAGIKRVQELIAQGSRAS